MPEQEPQVTFTDRRKISSDGEIRPEAAAQSAAEYREAEQRQAAQSHAADQQSAARREAETNASTQAAASSTVKPSPSNVVDIGKRSEETAQDEEMPQGPTAEETAQSHAAYRETTQQLDEILRTKAPDTGNLGPVSFDHVIQSMYMTAMLALGASTQPGEKPRIDLMGARQTIDLLGVLQEKTRGNLTPDEQRLLESALFELRMMFLEITNAIARNAANPKQQPPPNRK